jgi:hypothetical protein
MRRRSALGLAIAALPLMVVLGPSLAQGEQVQRGNVIVSINGGIAPLKLPRDRAAPVAIQLEGGVRSADGSPVPRVRKVELGLAGHGLLFTRGLPVCPRARLRNASSRQALERCRPALVGRGRLDAQVLVPHQAPFTIHTRLLAFNGRSGEGGTAVWVHAFAADPPVSIVLPFVVVRRRSGGFRTALVITIPHSVGSLPHLARFQITLSRRFSYRGRRRSYLSASCPLPPALTAGFFSFARATYSFADGRRVSVDTVRSCRGR